MRVITEAQARAVRQILVEECGMSPDDGRCSFVRIISDTTADCREWRFGGALGFGGKFKNWNETPYVDCYREHETPERLAMLDRANARLADLFRAEP